MADPAPLLYDSLANGDVLSVDLQLSAGCDVHLKVERIRGYSGSESPPLFIAVAHGHVALIQLLLDKGAEAFDPYSDDFPTVLHLLGAFSLDAFKDAYRQIARLILERDTAHIETLSQEGQTPLDVAARHGNLEFMKMLLEFGAQIEGNVSPLSEAAGGGHMPVVQFLLDQGVRTDRFPISNACCGGHVDIVRLLITHGLDEGIGPLHMAAARGHTDVVQFLLDNGTVAEATVEDHQTALHVAATASIARILIDSGYNPRDNRCTAKCRSKCQRAEQCRRNTTMDSHKRDAFLRFPGRVRYRQHQEAFRGRTLPKVGL